MSLQNRITDAESKRSTPDIRLESNDPARNTMKAIWLLQKNQAAMTDMLNTLESVGNNNNGEGISEESEDVQETLKKLQSEIGEIKSRVMLTSGSDHSQFDEYQFDSDSAESANIGNSVLNSQRSNADSTKSQGKHSLISYIPKYPRPSMRTDFSVPIDDKFSYLRVEISKIPLPPEPIKKSKSKKSGNENNGRKSAFEMSTGKKKLKKKDRPATSLGLVAHRRHSVMSNESSQIPRTSSRTLNQENVRMLNSYSSLGYFNRSQSRPMTSLDDYEDDNDNDLSKKRYSSCSLTYPILKATNDINKDERSTIESQSGDNYGNKHNPLLSSSTSSDKYYQQQEQEQQQNSVVVPKLDLNILRNDYKNKNVLKNNNEEKGVVLLQKISSSGELKIEDNIVNNSEKDLDNNNIVNAIIDNEDKTNIHHHPEIDDPITVRNNVIIDKNIKPITNTSSSSSSSVVAGASRSTITESSKKKIKNVIKNMKHVMVKGKIKNKSVKKTDLNLNLNLNEMEDEKERDGLEISEIPNDLSAYESSPCGNKCSLFMEKDDALELDFDNKSYNSMYHINKEEITDFSDMGSTCNFNELMDTHDSNKLFDNNYQDEEMIYFTNDDSNFTPCLIDTANTHDNEYLLDENNNLLKKEIINISTNDLYNMKEENKTLDSANEILTDSSIFENSSMTDITDDKNDDYQEICEIPESNCDTNSNNHEKTHIRHKSMKSFSFNTKDKIFDEEMILNDENPRNIDKEGSIFEYKEINESKKQNFRLLVPILNGHNQLDMGNRHGDFNYVTPRLNFGINDSKDNGKSTSQMTTIPERQKSKVNPLYSSQQHNLPSNRLSLSSTSTNDSHDEEQVRSSSNMNHCEKQDSNTFEKLQVYNSIDSISHSEGDLTIPDPNEKYDNTNQPTILLKSGNDLFPEEIDAIYNQHSNNVKKDGDIRSTVLKPVFEGSDATESNKNKSVKSDDLDGIYLVDVSNQNLKNNAKSPSLNTMPLAIPNAQGIIRDPRPVPHLTPTSNEKQSNNYAVINNQIKDNDTGSNYIDILPEIEEEEEEENLNIKNSSGNDERSEELKMMEKVKLYETVVEKDSNGGREDGRDENVVSSKDSEMINEAMKEENIYASNHSISNLSSNSVINVENLEDTWNTSHNNNNIDINTYVNQKNNKIKKENTKDKENKQKSILSKVKCLVPCLCISQPNVKY